MYSKSTSSAIGERNAEKWNEILFYTGITGIIGLAIFFRSQGYFDGNINFWWDEAAWAIKLIKKPFISVIKIRPVGYMLLTKLLINISKDETVFRLLSYLPSILAIPLVFFIAKRIWKSKLVILLIVFLTAFNPILISFAKEFKPYALDFFVHACFIYLALQYIQSKNDSLLYTILTYAICSIFFCYNIVFIFPSVFLILLFDAYSHRNYKRLALVVATALLIFLELYLMYRFIFAATTNIARQESYWANKYDVFFLGSSLIEQFKWIVSKYAGLVNYSGITEIFWPGISGLAPVIDLMLIFFHMFGVLSFLLEKKYTYLILFLLPITTVILINCFGVWPFGPFRANLFLFLYFLILTVNGFNFFISMKNTILRYVAYCIVVVLFFILQLPINFHYYTIKPRDTWVAQSDVRKALEIIIQYEKARESGGSKNYREIPVIADRGAYRSTYFYLNYHQNAAGFTKSLRELNVQYSRVISESIIGKLKSLSRNPKTSQELSWFVIGKPATITKIEAIINKMPERIVYRKKFSYAGLVVLMKM
jgi:hypothetical protein